MDYDFIEIGTSDFDTEIQICDEYARGLSIDPNQFYLDRLPDKQGVKKLCCAISNHDGQVDYYYTPLEVIIKYNLPSWVRGCSSIGSPHKTVVDLTKDIKEQVIFSNKVKCIRLETLFKENNVSSISLLKIDTEGHDSIILQDSFNAISSMSYECRPKTIIYEANVLSNLEDVQKVNSIYSSIGYEIQVAGENCVLKLRN